MVSGCLGAGGSRVCPALRRALSREYWLPISYCHTPCHRNESAARCSLHSLSRTHHAEAATTSSRLRLHGEPHNSRVQRLGLCGPAIPCRSSGIHRRCRQFLSRRRTRLDSGGDQPPADHRGPSLGGRSFTGRDSVRRSDDSDARRHQRLHSQSRRPDRPIAIDARNTERSGAPSRARSGLRSRHAEPRVHASAARRIPDRG